MERTDGKACLVQKRLVTISSTPKRLKSPAPATEAGDFTQMPSRARSTTQCQCSEELAECACHRISHSPHPQRVQSALELQRSFMTLVRALVTAERYKPHPKEKQGNDIGSAIPVLHFRDLLYDHAQKKEFEAWQY